MEDVIYAGARSCHDPGFASCFATRRVKRTGDLSAFRFAVCDLCLCVFVRDVFVYMYPYLVRANLCALEVERGHISQRER